MSRWQRPLLLFSLALNVGFVSLAAVHHAPREDRLPPPLIEPPPDPRALHAWRAHRRAELGHVLDLDAGQQQRLNDGFEGLRPQLRAARLEVMSQRLAYGQALVRGDDEAARAATRGLSRAQAHVDSLCAEAMLQETAVLRPEQRARYVRWTFRHGPGGGPGFGTGAAPGLGRGLGPGGPPPGPAPDPEL